MRRLLPHHLFRTRAQRRCHALPSEMQNSLDIQLVSDLHLETPLLRPRYDTFELPVKARYLALLGDIGKANQPGLFSFLKKQLQRYEIVFYLLGNHEAYREGHEHSSFDRARTLVRNFEIEMTRARSESDTSLGQFVFLDRTRFDFPGTNISILGCTLFSLIRPEQQQSVTLKVSDFSAFGPGSGHIDDWDVAAHNKAHSKDLQWLNTMVSQLEQEANPRTVVVFTHHSPTILLQANDPAHLRDERQVNSAFVTDLSSELCWYSKVVKLWAFGHTHFNCDFVADRSVHSQGAEPDLIRIVTNQLGYFRSDESPGFDEMKVVRLGKTSLLHPF